MRELTVAAPTTLVVTGERVRAYAEATDDPDPRYAAGDVAPPMFAAVAASEVMMRLLADGTLPADRLLHRSQDMTFLAPVRCGDELVTEWSFADRTSTRAGETLTTDLVTRSTSGQVCCLVRMGAFISPGPAGPPRDPAHAEPPVGGVVRRVAADQPARYARASGDTNRPHTDEAFARRLGFRTVILHGLCTMAFAAQAVIAEACAGEPGRLRRLSVRFQSVVYPGDVLHTFLTPDGSLRMVNQDGVRVLRGRAEVG